MIKVTGIRNFKADLLKFAEKINADADQVIKTVAFFAFQSCVEKTPVDTGFARSRWEIQEIEKQHWTITNNAPYIVALENGWSKQSEKGYMVARTLNDIEANLGDLVRKVIKK